MADKPGGKPILRVKFLEVGSVPPKDVELDVETAEKKGGGLELGVR